MVSFPGYIAEPQWHKAHTADIVMTLIVLEMIILIDHGDSSKDQWIHGEEFNSQVDRQC